MIRIKVLERIVLWLATPILACVFTNFAWLILPVGALCLWKSWPTHEEVYGVAKAHGSAQEQQGEVIVAAAAATAPAAGKPRRQRASPGVSQKGASNDGESEEDFLERQRFAEYCNSH